MRKESIIIKKPTYISAIPSIKKSSLPAQRYVGHHPVGLCDSLLILRPAVIRFLVLLPLINPATVGDTTSGASTR